MSFFIALVLVKLYYRRNKIFINKEEIGVGMNYKEAMIYIDKKNESGSVLGLESIKELLLRLSNPQDKINVIHIAGTNGKGSILAFIESILVNAGYTVGRYISPTIFTYLERFQINDKYMSEEDFSKYLDIVKDKVIEMENDGFSSPTAFEIETAVSFIYFLDKKVDFVLLETGMGGRLDGTNVVARPICEVMASISMDHMQFLGDTIDKIAYEKAGIIMPDTICVSYPNGAQSLSVIENECRKNKATLITVNKDDALIKSQTIDFTKFSYKGMDLTIKLLGKHQVLNSITAIEVCNVLRDKGYDVLDAHIVNGLCNTTWPGRFEIIGHNPIVIRDGAHNENAAYCLADTIQNHFTNKPIIYIIGMLRDKEYEKVLEITGTFAKTIYTITPPGIRGLESHILAKVAREYCDNVIDRGYTDIKDVLSEATDMAGREGVVIVFGSLSYIGQLL